MAYEKTNKTAKNFILEEFCEGLLENYEADIEDWYHNHQGQIPLIRYLCSERALKGQNDSCLHEKTDTGKDVKKKEKKKRKVSKEDTNNKESMKDNSQNVKQEL